LGDPIAHPHGWVNQINDSSLSAVEKSEVIGLLFAEQSGFDLGLRPYQINDLKAKARSTGITFRRPLSKQGNLYMQLDLDSGTCIVKKSI